MPTRVGRWIGIASVLGMLQPSYAYYLDEARRFDVRLRAYSQLGIMTEDSATQGCPTPEQVAQAKAITNPAQRQQQLAFLYQTCPPHYSAGDLGQQRNFYNPEFDANLTDFMGWAKADEFKFRFAWWGFYDGLYDYLSDPWNTHRQNYTTRYSQSDDIAHESKF